MVHIIHFFHKYWLPCLLFVCLFFVSLLTFIVILIIILGTLDDGKRKDVDKDVILLVTVIDENSSFYIEQNIRDYCTDPDSVDPGRFIIDTFVDNGKRPSAKTKKVIYAINPSNFLSFFAIYFGKLTLRVDRQLKC